MKVPNWSQFGKNSLTIIYLYLVTLYTERSSNQRIGPQVLGSLPEQNICKTVLIYTLPTTVAWSRQKEMDLGSEIGVGGLWGLGVVGVRVGKE